MRLSCQAGVDLGLRPVTGVDQQRLDVFLVDRVDVQQVRRNDLLAVVVRLGVVGLRCATGQDAEIESVALINKDVQWSTIFKDTRKLAAKAVEVSQAYLSGGTPEANDTKTYNNGTKIVPSYLLDVDTVNKEDIKPLLIDSGYWTQAQVDAGLA